MNRSIKNSVISTVKKTIQRVTGIDERPSSLNHLVIMNTPVLMARRDAAYKRASLLLREHLFSYTEEGRHQIYVSVLELLNIAEDMTREIISPLRGHNSGAKGPMLQYLKLLNDTVQAAATLVKHELVLFQDEKDLTSFLGKDISNQFRSTDEIFSNSEMSIYHCIIELSEIAEPAIERYRDMRKRSFAKNDLNRYKKAFSEFSALYSKYGKIDSKYAIS